MDVIWTDATKLLWLEQECGYQAEIKRLRVLGNPQKALYKVVFSPAVVLHRPKTILHEYVYGGYAYPKIETSISSFIYIVDGYTHVKVNGEWIPLPWKSGPS